MTLDQLMYILSSNHLIVEGREEQIRALISQLVVSVVTPEPETAVTAVTETAEPAPPVPVEGESNAS